MHQAREAGCVTRGGGGQFKTTARRMRSTMWNTDGAKSMT